MSEGLAVVGASQPIVLIGRGGGGTRLLSELAAGLGVFLGNKLNVSFDSVEWVKSIYGIAIKSCTASAPLDSVQIDQDVRTLHKTAADILSKGAQNPSGLWGWKLPETTVIAPRVSLAFPNARFVHLTRHPVASCCRRSHMTSRLDSQLGQAVLSAAYKHHGRPWSKVETDTVAIHNAISWAFQANIAATTLETQVEERYQISLRYEDLCTDPIAAQRTLQKFLGLTPNQTEETRMPLKIDPARRNDQSRTHPDAQAVWDICANQAQRLGYTWQS